MDKEIYSVKLLPLLRVELDDNKVRYTDNLSNEEIRDMSVEPRMLWNFPDEVFLAEMPLTYRGGYVNRKLFYVFDELNDEEKCKYDDRTIMMNVTIPHVVEVYNKDKPKKKKRTNKKK